jgi:HK97 family phage major capsid protein
MSVEKDIESINASLKLVNDGLKAHADQAQKDIKAHSKLSEETRANVDKLLTTQGELQARLQASEQLIAKMENGGISNAREKTLGELVAESDDVKGFNPSVRSSISMSVKMNRPLHAAVTRDPGSAGSLIVPQRLPGVVGLQQQRLFLRDLLPWGRAEGNSIEYVRETGFTNNANVVAENPTDPKPESDIHFEPDSEKVVTIAHWIRASKQVLRDANQLAAYINGRMMFGLKVKEELQLLKGSGTGLNVNGLYTQASTYVNPGVTVQAETRLDRLRLAMLQTTLAEYDADGIVLNPIDWTAIELTKTTQNAYLFANAQGLAVPTLWSRPVVATKAMDVTDFLVGAFQMGAMGWDREDANITVSNQDRDNFVKNMVTILCEEDVALTVFRPEAFVKGDFAGLAQGAGAGAGGA